MRGRVEVDVAAFGLHLPSERVDLHDPLDLVPEEVDPHDVLAVGRLHLENVAAHPEARARQGRVVALVLQVDEVAKDPVAAVSASGLQADHGRAVVDGCAEPVDAAHRCHDHDVSPLEERSRGVMPQSVDLVVPG